MKLHLGCGSKHMDGYVNIDIEKWAGGVDIETDARDLSMYQTETVDHIFSHALLEHIAPWDTVPTLAEWFRVLKSNGTIQIEVPDLERIFEDWLVNRTLGEKEAIDNIFGGLSPDKRYERQYHLTGFTYDKLTRMMKEVGFIECRRIEPIKFRHILIVHARKL